MADGKKNFFGSAIGIAIAAAVLFGTAWVLSKGWKAGQK